MLLAIAGCAMALELLPAPRKLYAAEVPAIYSVIAADPRPVRVLELPFGVRDGLSSLGDFTARSQFYQTLHGKELIGGYLSRVSEKRKAFYLRDPFFRALLALSEKRPIDAADLPEIRVAAQRFLARSHVGYVVIDSERAIPELQPFLDDVLGRPSFVERSGSQQLYRVREP